MSDPIAPSVAFVKGAPDMIEGLAIPFGGPFKGKDLDGESFDSETDFCLDWFDDRPILFDHGTDGTVKTTVVGRQTSAEMTDAGVWVRAQLDKKSRYRSHVDALIEQHAVGFSSGAMAHLVQVEAKGGRIKRWPWVELSLTPTPANPDAVAYPVKSLDALAHLATIDSEVPASVAAALKALDEWADAKSDQVSRSLDEEGQQVTAALDAFAKRARERLAVRKDDGRKFSAANRERLSALLGQLDDIDAVRDDIRKLLSETDPQKPMTALEAQAEMERARLGGVPV